MSKIDKDKRILNLNGAKAIESSDRIRAEKCRADIDRILNFYECSLVPTVSIEPGIGVFGGIKVVAKQRDEREMEVN